MSGSTRMERIFPASAPFQPSITSYQDKFLKFKVINYCEKQQVAMVGNFRTAGAPSANPDDCKKAMDSDSFAPIFQDDSEKKRTASPNAAESDGDPSDDTIKLKIRKTDDLPKVPGILEYDFDVCLGGKKADPRLVIER